MEIKENFKLEKNLTKYFCEFCDFKCRQKCDWDRHILRPKHLFNQGGNVKEIKKLEKTFSCMCGRQFKTNSGLWKHQSKCNNLVKKEEVKIQTECEAKNINIDKELMLMIINQNKELLEIVKNGTHNTVNTTHTNSHNKAFNLNFFLNETCKNAMNITEFVDSIKLQLSDLMEVGELGYVEGISKIIVKNLNNLDETVRPIHCTDKKRETMYVKDAGQWEKEDDNKTRLKKVINKVVDKNIRLLPQFREKYPEYRNSASKISDVHDKMVIEVMETDDEKKDKIITNISKSTSISNKSL
jgi:hypothetical protein